jgi:large subunit ribosomal protein L21
MYAVIKTGGKQHKVQPGDVIEVELMHGIGTTHYGKDAAKAVVTAKPVGEQKGDKVKIFKYKNKTGYARKAGHRQLLTLLEISTVSLGGATKTAAKKPAKTEEPEAAADATADAPADAPATAEASE